MSEADGRKNVEGGRCLYVVVVSVSECEKENDVCIFCYAWTREERGCMYVVCK